ncbi:MAG: amidohydrolase [Variovorax sp.]|nr:MAG: amidohydrolase [Variovorax sp.]
MTNSRPRWLLGLSTYPDPETWHGHRQPDRDRYPHARRSELLEPVRQLRRGVRPCGLEEHGVKGFKFHPTVQGYHPYDKMAWPIYEVINEYGLPAVFHTGHSGIGSGMRCGGGLRLEYSNPIHLDDVAIDFPDMQIVMAHPSFPWQDEALSVATHKPNVWIDLSGWSPKYFPKQLVQYANTLLKDRVLFASDWPLISPERWLKDAEDAGFKPEVMPGILKGNAMRLLKLGSHAATAAPPPDIAAVPAPGQAAEIAKSDK